jgi:hypothetical protein
MGGIRKMLKKILGWLFIPYVMIGILVARKTNSKIAGVAVGILVYLILWNIPLLSDNETQMPMHNTEQEQSDKRLVVESSPSPSPSPKKTVKKTKKTTSKLDVKTASAVLKDSYKGIAVVKIEGSNILITPTDKNFAAEVYMASLGDKDKIKDWNVIKSALIDTSKNVKDGTMLVIVNPVNAENWLLAVGSGIVVYDYVEEGGI